MTEVKITFIPGKIEKKGVDEVSNFENNIIEMLDMLLK